MKYLIATFWIISVIVAYVIGSMLGNLEYAFQPVVKVEPVVVNGVTKAYIKKRSWGLLGNHSVIFLTNYKDRDRPNEHEDLIFLHEETIFFQTLGDTLKIYTREQHVVNPNFETNLILQCHQLDNPQFMNLYDRVHRQLKSTDGM